MGKSDQLVRSEAPQERTPSKPIPPEHKATARRKRSSEAAQPWHRSITLTALKTCKRRGPLDRDTAEHMVRTFRAVVVPRGIPGSKPDKETVQAAKLYQAGMEARCANPDPPPMREYLRALWQHIYREVFPDYAALDKLERQDRTSKLRRNVR